MISNGIPTVSMAVTNGKGGRQGNAIPVREDLNGETTGYLENGRVIRVVDPSYPGISKFRRIYNGTTWVQFDLYGKDLVAGRDGWCELTGHLVMVEPDDNPEPGPEVTEILEILAESWEGGRRFLKVRKIQPKKEGERWV